jgi:hypothetical protein
MRSHTLKGVGVVVGEEAVKAREGARAKEQREERTKKRTM